MRKLVILNSVEIPLCDVLISPSPPLQKGGMFLGKCNNIKPSPQIPPFNKEEQGVGTTESLNTESQISPFYKGGLGGILLPNATTIPFSNAKSLLGNEYPFAIYDMRAENGVNFNLEAFAIVAGTIQRKGTLYLLCDDWDNVENSVDFDSLRWNDGRAICTPKFWVFFKELVKKYHFLPPMGEVPCEAGGRGLQIPPTVSLRSITSPTGERKVELNHAQQYILQNLPKHSADIHLITAPRGRGKSTLSGKLAEVISADHSVIITARSRAALPNFWQQIENNRVQFFAPDHLIQAVENGEKFAKTWLFIDEAASLPLPMLQKLCSTFGKVVMTTTTQNYEGTGHGFALKLPKMLEREFRHWTLSQPLRWNENDPLERFVNELLLNEDISYRTVLIPPSPPLLKGGTLLGKRFTMSSSKKGIQREIFCESSTSLFLPQHVPPSNKGGLGGILDFYNLLSLAHYKTTPTDLRRLFDGENQQLFEIRENQQLIAGAWGIFEGGLDSELAQAIWRGERRPKGNLLAQYLCFQANFPLACQLRSLRISRIAVTPGMQGKGYGKRLISEIILQNSKQNSPLDFVSVSFGMNDELLNFWRECDFRLVQISQNPEASSGLLSAMMILPISAQGKAFAEQAEQQFLRNQLLQKNAEIQLLDEWDWQNLQGFITANRTLSACLPSLIRLYQRDTQLTEIKTALEQPKLAKSELIQLKSALSIWLKKHL